MEPRSRLVASSSGTPSVVDPSAGGSVYKSEGSRRYALLRSAIILSVLALASWAAWRQLTALQVVTVQPAESRDFWTSFTAEGVVKGTEYSVGSETGGRVVELWVRDGDTVHKGQVLFRLNSDQPQHLAAEMEAALRSSLADVSRARRERDLLISQQRAGLASAKARLRQAEFEHRRLLSGSRPEELEQAAQRTARAEATLEEAEHARNRAEALYKEGAVSLAQFERADAAFKTAQADLRAAESAEKLLRAGPSEESIEVSRAAFLAAQADVDRQESESGRIDVAGQAVASASYRADQARAALERVRSSVQEQRVVAPSDGTVTKLLIEEGAILTPGASALLISTRKDLRVEAEISTEDTSKIEPGMEVLVTAAAYPGKVFRGKVQAIMPAGELKPDAAIRTRIVRATVHLTEGADLFRPGMEVDVEGKRLLGKRLSVPTDSIKFTGSSPSVLVFENGIVRERPVQIGIQNPDRTEIISGLGPAELVIPRGKDELHPGDKVKLVGR